MKKFSLYFLSILGVIILTQSCKKNVASITSTNSELLKHKWTWISETRTIPAYPQGNLWNGFSNGSYSDFHADGKVYNFLYNEYDTSYYNVINDKLSLILIQNGQRTDSTNATILSLNSSNLVLSFSNIYYQIDSTGIEKIYTGVIIDSLKR